MPEEKEVEEEKTVMIDGSDKWTAADTIVKDVQVDTLDGPATFKIKAMSGDDHSRMLATIVNPEAPLVQNFRGVNTPNEEDNDYLMAKAEVELKRRVMAIDMCWMEIPGDTLDSKVQWASENLHHRDEIKQLYHSILQVSGFGSGRIEQTKNMPVIITDPKAWAESARRPAQLVFTRTNGDKIAFILKPISRIVSMQIEQSCPEPEVPSVPAPGKASRMKQFVKNDKDPAYLQKVKAMQDKRQVLVFEASLDWKLPGDDFESKVSWLNKRPAGEISGMYTTIMNTVNKFQGRSDFM